MPTYTPGQRRYILQQSGYDPDSYDFDDAGNITPKVAEPEILPGPQPITPNGPQAPGLLETAARGAAQATLPTGAGIGGSLLGAALVPPAPPLGALIGGFLASKLAGYGQEKLLPKSVQEAAFLRPIDIETNRKTAIASGLLPSALAFNPIAGARQVAGIAGRVPNMVRNPLFAAKTLTDAERAALTHVGAGTGISTAINLGEQAVRGEGIDPTELAVSALGGALFNSPYKNRLNAAIGLHPLPDSQPIVLDRSEVPDTWAPYNLRLDSSLPNDPIVRAIIEQQTGISRKPTGIKPLTREEAQNQKGLDLDSSLPNTPVVRDIIEHALGIGRINPTVKPLSAKEVSTTMDPLNLDLDPRLPKDPIVRAFIERELGISRPKVAPLQPLTREEAIAQGGEPLPVKRGPARPITQRSDVEGLIQGDPSDVATRINVLNEQSARRAQHNPPKGPGLEPIEVYAKRVKAYIDASPFAKDIEAVTAMRRVLFSARDSLENPIVLLQADMAAKDVINKSYPDSRTAIQQKNAGRGEPVAYYKGKDGIERPLYKEGDIDAEASLPITPEAEAIAARRGVHVADEPSLPPGIQGLSYSPTRQVRLNPKNSDTSTLGHEALGHQFVKDLRVSKDPRDITLVEKMEATAKALKIKPGSDTDEFIANAIGSDFQRRINLRLSGSNKERFSSWLRDLKDSWDYYKGNNDPAARLLTLRGLTDAPYGTRSELLGKPSTTPQTHGNIGQRTSNISGVQQEPTTNQPGIPTPESSQTGRTTSGDTGERSSRGSTVIEGDTPKPSGASSTGSSTTSDTSRGTTDTAGDSGRIIDREKLSRITIKPTSGTTSTEQSGSLSKSTGGDEGGVSQGGSPKEQAGDSSGSGKVEGKATTLPGEDIQNTESTAFATGTVKSRKGEVPEPVDAPRRRLSIPGIRSGIDALKAKAQEMGSKAPRVIKALETFAEKHTLYSGQFKDSLLHGLRGRLGIKMHPSNASAWLKGDSITSQRVLKYLDEVSDKGSSSIKLNRNEQSIVDDIYAKNREVRAEAIKRGFEEEGSGDPKYFQQTISQHAIDVLKNKRNTPEGLKFRKDFIEHASERLVNKSKGKMSKAAAVSQAEDTFASLLKGFSQKDPNIASQFGPIDKAEGLGIPPSMREPQLVRRLSNYLERVAIRFAHHDSLEASPDTHEAMFGKEGLISNDNVRQIYHRMSGIRPPTEQVLEGVTGIVKAAVTGTVAGVRDVVTTPFLGAQHQDFWQMPRTALAALAKIPAHWSETFDRGLNKEHVGSIESGDVAASWPGLNNSLRRLRDVGNEVQFRNWLEQLSRTWAYTNGKILAAENLTAVANGRGSSQQKRFLENFAEGQKDYKALLKDANAIKDIAQRYAESVVGTYDARGLPQFALEGPLAPLLSLNRWSIEKTNNFVKYAIDPALKGDYRPLLNQTSWLLLGGGAAIEALNELLTKKKSKLPSIKELEAANTMGGDWKEGLAYKAIGLAAMSGYAGELANVVKMMADSRYKNSDRWYNLLAVEFAHRTSAYVPEFVGALTRGDIGTALDISSDYLSEYSQTYRVATHLLSEEAAKKLRSQDENRDVKMFKQLMDKDLGEIPSDVVKDYSKQAQREFRQAREPEDVIAKAPAAIAEAFSKVKDPESYQSATRSLQSQSYRGFPDIENTPKSAADFYQFLTHSQGDNQAKARMLEAMRMKEINKLKRSIVPH